MLNIKNLWKNKQVEKSTNNPTTCKKHLHFGKKYCIVIKRQLSDTKEWLVGQAVKTSPSHGENRGSIPLLAVFENRNS